MLVKFNKFYIKIIAVFVTKVKTKYIIIKMFWGKQNHEKKTYI